MARQAPGTAADTSHLAALDLLRGVAILGVIWYHLSVNRMATGWWLDTGPFAFAGTWVTNGWMGVNLFFILSGFVLYLPYAGGQRSMASRNDALLFYKRRAQRLLPLFYLSSLILIGIRSAPWPREELLLLTLSFNFSANTFLPDVNFVLWSLGVEIWFSMLFPLLLLALSRWGWFGPTVFVFIAALVLRVLGSPTPETVAGHSLPFINPLKDSVIGRLDDFFVGMGLAALHARGWRCPRPRTMLVAGALLCTLAAVTIDFVARGALPWTTFALSNTVFQAGTALLLPALLQLPRLRSIPLELLGMMCYSLYIWHGVIIKHVEPDPASLLSMIRFAALFAAVSWLSYRYVEFGHVRDTARLLPPPKQSPG